MRKILVTGGTTFVSRGVAQHFMALGDEAWVLNRGNREQVSGVHHIKADRHSLGKSLERLAFDAVLDVTAYTGEDVKCLLSSLGDFGVYVLVSSSAVYPETEKQPFTEKTPVGRNSLWGEYGTNKIAAETCLRKNCENYYILRPPYLYGEGENLYREPFVFDCALRDRVFALPQSDMKLQFFYVKDLCRFMDVLISERPEERVYNVGNPETVSVKKWVTLCYEALGKSPKFTVAEKHHPIRDYFCFYDYDYALSVKRMRSLMPEVTPLCEGLKNTAEWYRDNADSVLKKPYTDYIDRFIR